MAAAASMLWQQQLCYGRSNYPMVAAAMFWQHQLCCGSSYNYAMAAACMLLAAMLPYGSYSK